MNERLSYASSSATISSRNSSSGYPSITGIPRPSRPARSMNSALAHVRTWRGPLNSAIAAMSPPRSMTTMKEDECVSYVVMD